MQLTGGGVRPIELLTCRARGFDVRAYPTDQAAALGSDRGTPSAPSGASRSTEGTTRRKDEYFRDADCKVANGSASQFPNVLDGEVVCDLARGARANGSLIVDSTTLEHGPAISDVECEGDVLLNQQHGGPSIALAAEHCCDLMND